MKEDNKKNYSFHKAAKSIIDITCANNKAHHFNDISATQQKKTSSKKDIFSLNGSYNNFFTKLIH